MDLPLRSANDLVLNGYCWRNEETMWIQQYSSMIIAPKRRAKGEEKRNLSGILVVVKLK